ncbi:unnamed protein product [Closterium sp. NIES-65]|nr:unnamed protein product [Closterium sp. NIES-65]
MPCHPMTSRPMQSQHMPSRPITSRPMQSQHMPSRPITFHPMPSHATTWQVAALQQPEWHHSRLHCPTHRTHHLVWPLSLHPPISRSPSNPSLSHSPSTPLSPILCTMIPCPVISAIDSKVTWIKRSELCTVSTHPSTILALPSILSSISLLHAFNASPSSLRPSPHLPFHCLPSALCPPSPCSREIRQFPFRMDSGLSGSIPEAISSLKQLQRLYLNDNILSGSIPEAISSLKQLRELFLQDNRLSGTIPACIGNLTALTSLCAHSPSNPPSPYPSFRMPLSAKHRGFGYESTEHFLSSSISQGTHFSSSLLHFSSPPLPRSSPPLPPFSASSLLLVTSSPLFLSFPPCPFIHLSSEYSMPIALQGRYLLQSPRSLISNTLLHIFSSLLLVISSSLHLFFSSSRHLFISSSPHLFFSSSLHLFFSSSLLLFFYSSLLLLISSSRHLFISSSLLLFISSSLLLFISSYSVDKPI